MLLEIECGWCELVFYMCRKCWRGHKYCCDECRLLAKRVRQCKTQRKYRQTENGKKKHCESEKKRRLKQNRGRNSGTAISRGVPLWCAVMVLLLKKYAGRGAVRGKKITRCLFCGVTGHIVHKFPVRGYGNSNTIFDTS